MSHKHVVIVRGWPGMGKTTMVEEQFDKCPEDTEMVLVSADIFWEWQDKENFNRYVFDGKKLSEAHAFCRGMFWTEIFDVPKGNKVIFVDNTNIKLKDFQWYIDIAAERGYDVFQMVPEWIHPKEAGDRNTHGVPLETCLRMAEQFQVSFLPKWSLELLT